MAQRGTYGATGTWTKAGWRLAPRERSEGPDVTLTLSRKDAASLCRGDLDPSVAFMQGRLKVAGSMGVMISLLTAMNTPEYRGLRQTIAQSTEF